MAYQAQASSSKPSPDRPSKASGNADQAQAKARARVNMACNHCRQRKIRCDGILPQCSSCARLRRPCTYQPVPVLENEANRERKRRSKQRKLEEEAAAAAAAGAEANFPHFQGGHSHDSTSSSGLGSPFMTASTLPASRTYPAIPSASRALKATLAQRRARGATVVTSLESAPESSTAARRRVPYTAAARPMKQRSSPSVGESSTIDPSPLPASASSSSSILSGVSDLGPHQSPVPYSSHVFGGPDSSSGILSPWYPATASAPAAASIMSLRRRSSFDSSGVLEAMQPTSSNRLGPLPPPFLPHQSLHSFDGLIPPPPLSENIAHIIPRPDAWTRLPHDDITLHLDVYGNPASSGAHPSGGGGAVAPTAVSLHAGWQLPPVDAAFYPSVASSHHAFSEADQTHPYQRTASEPDFASFSTAPAPLPLQQQQQRGEVLAGPFVTQSETLHGIAVPSSAYGSSRGSPALLSSADTSAMFGFGMLGQTLLTSLQHPHQPHSHGPSPTQSPQHYGALSAHSLSPNSSRNSGNESQDGPQARMHRPGAAALDFVLPPSHSSSTSSNSFTDAARHGGLGGGFLPAPGAQGPPLSSAYHSPPSARFFAEPQRLYDAVSPPPAPQQQQQRQAYLNAPSSYLSSAAAATGGWPTSSHPASPEARLQPALYDLQITDTTTRPSGGGPPSSQQPSRRPSAIFDGVADFGPSSVAAAGGSCLDAQMAYGPGGGPTSGESSSRTSEGSLAFAGGVAPWLGGSDGGQGDVLGGSADTGFTGQQCKKEQQQ